jgi:hypothetical protein
MMTDRTQIYKRNGIGAKEGLKIRKTVELILILNESITDYGKEGMQVGVGRSMCRFNRGQ